MNVPKDQLLGRAGTRMFVYAGGSVHLFNHLKYSLSTSTDTKYVAVQYIINSSLRRKVYICPQDSINKIRLSNFIYNREKKTGNNQSVHQ